MRARALICVPLLLLALSACRSDDRPGAAPSAPGSSPAATLASTATPEPAGPGTNCGEVRTLGDGAMAAVGVLKGHVACSTAMAVFRTYYRAETPKQGSAGVATVRGWLCASNTAAETSRTGRASTCRRSGVEITADVIP